MVVHVFQTRQFVAGSIILLSGLFFLITASLPITIAQSEPTPPNPSSAQAPSIQVGLVPGIQLEGELQAEQKQSFTVQLEANQFVRIEVEQQGIDVIVRLFDPAGKQVQEMDSANGAKGPEHLRYVTVEAGTYRVEVAALEKGAKPGKYTIRLGEIRLPKSTEADEIQYDRLMTQINALINAGQFQTALPVAEQAVTLAKQLFGTESAQSATAILNSGIVNYHLFNLALAESSYLQALALRERLFGADHESTHEIIYNLAGLYKTKGEFDKAMTFAQRAIALLEKASGENHPHVAMAYNTLGEIYRAQNKFDQAQTTFQTALLRMRAAEKPEPSGETSILNNLALTFYGKGDFVTAVQLLKEVVAQRKEFVGEQHPLYAIGLLNLAEAYRQIGRFDDMEALMRQALAIEQKTSGPHSVQAAYCLNSLGDYYREIGNYGLAEINLQQALAIFEKVFGHQHPELCATLINLGALSLDRFDFQAADEYFQRALTIHQAQSPKNELEIGKIYGHLVVSAQRQSKLDQLIEFNLRQHALYEKNLPPTHSLIGSSALSLGVAYRLNKDFQNAKLWLEKAEKHLLSRPAPRPEEYLVVYQALGWYYFDLNELEQVKSYLHKADSMLTQVVDQTALNAIQLLYLHLFMALRQNDFQEATHYLAQLQEKVEQRWVNNLVIGSEFQKKSLLLNALNTWVDQTIWVQLNHSDVTPELTQLALQAIIRKKGRTLDVMAENINTIRLKSPPEGQAILDELFLARSKLSNLILRGPGKSPIEKYQARLVELETQTRELEAKLSALSFQYRQLATSITLHDVQTVIPAQSTLIEFFLFYPFSIETQTFGAPRCAVYTLDRNGKIGFADLGERSEIDNMVKEFRQALAVAGDQRNLTKIKLSTERRKSLNQVQKLARQLDARLLQPVRKFIGDKDHLLISPDGALNLIPFAALVDESHRYLVESHEITYLSSGRDLLRLKDKIPTNQPAMVLANPRFDDGPGPTIFGQHFDPLVQLPGSEREGKFFKSLFPKTQLKQGVDATEAILKQVQQPELLHIASHGYFLDPDQAAQAAIEAFDNRSLSLGLSDQTISPDFIRQSSPLLRSMLFFSGANRRQISPETTDDGILTALEVSSLNLLGTKLVTLSACDTGIGAIKRGDGVFGLRRALVLAGSESQMISLWPVSDAGTRELMFKYYRRLKAGEGRSEALRNAQLSLIKNPKRNHPYFWASFIQSGEWANLDGKRKE